MENKANKFIATKMQKHLIGEKTNIYTSEEIIFGYITTDQKTFIDEEGKCYKNFATTNQTLEESTDNLYGNLIPLNSIDAVVDENLSEEEKLKEYFQKTKEIVYYVTMIKENIPYMIPINLEKVRYHQEQELEPIKEKNSSETISLLDTLCTNEESTYEEDDYTLEEIEESYKTGDLRPDIANVIQHAVNGDMSIDELKDTLSRFLKDQEDLTDAIDCLKLQIEATETGKVDLEKTMELEIPTAEVKEEKEEDSNFEFDSEKLLKTVKKTLIAQDKPLRRVITEIARKSQSPIKKKEALLITGSTGVGKTKMMELIAKNLNRTFYKVDSMQLTSPGYTGKDIEEVLWDLYIKCGKDKEKTENAIIFFDEIDKKGSKNKDDHSGQAILNMLLGFIEGTTYDACHDMKTASQKVKIDTKNMIVILGGAYADVYKNMRSKDIGFGATPGIEKTPTVQDFVEKSMMTDEFMGRVVVIKLNDLDVEAIKKIMEESDESALKIQEKLFDELGVKITFTDNYKTKIAEEVVKRKTGARGLNSIIDETTWEAYEEVYKTSSRGKYEEVIITEETLEDSSNYQLIKKRH